MQKRIHVIFDMDQALSENLDLMILEIGKNHVFGFGKRNIDDLLGRTSWLEGLNRIGKTLSKMADPDAAEIVPIFKEIFDEKKSMIESMEISRSLKDHILFALSQQRKLLGIDHRRFKNDDQPQRLEIAH